MVFIRSLDDIVRLTIGLRIEFSKRNGEMGIINKLKLEENSLGSNTDVRATRVVNSFANLETAYVEEDLQFRATETLLNP